ncbi:hypothetical protein [Ferrimonas kyonanensis]|uniref:hypothetical protein n=1 Tax=Ferrimonas kyonanensis TaxID=364763 RepID=UPI00041D3B8D|nr:hypothetical protein [Ferrimonas kyonanensis]
MALAAVLTGDIVNSQKMTTIEHQRCIATLDQIMEHCQKNYGAQGEIYRGDSFQLYTEQPEHGLTMALLFRLGLLSSSDKRPLNDARISIAVGPSDGTGDKVRSSSGPVFVLSGRALEEMGKERLCFSSPSSQLNAFYQVIFKYLDHSLGELKHKSAQALLLRIQEPDAIHEALAKQLEIDRTTFVRSLQRAGYAEIEATLALYQSETLNPDYWAQPSKEQEGEQ